LWTGGYVEKYTVQSTVLVKPKKSKACNAGERVKVAALRHRFVVMMGLLNELN
jgi:hypothetical protein